MKQSKTRYGLFPYVSDTAYSPGSRSFHEENPNILNDMDIDWFVMEARRARPLAVVISGSIVVSNSIFRFC